MKKLLLFLLLFVHMCAFSCSSIHYKTGSSPIQMTPEDKEFFDNFFFHSIDLDKIELRYADPRDNPNGLNFAVGNTIYLNPELDYEHHSLALRHLLVHELTHSWQYDNFRKDTFKPSGYQYYLFPERKLTDYGVEESAAFIEDYYRWTMEGLESPLRCLDCAIIGVEASLPSATRLYEQLDVTRSF